MMQMKITPTGLVPDKKAYISTNPTFSHWARLHNLDKVELFEKLWKVNIRQPREEQRNLQCCLIGGEFSILFSSMSQPELNTACSLEVSTVVKTESQEKPSQSGSRSRRGNSCGSESGRKALVLFHSFLQSAGYPAARVVTAEWPATGNCRNQDSGEGDIPLQLGEATAPEGQSQTLLLLWFLSLSILLLLGPGDSTVLEMGGFWLEEWQGQLQENGKVPGDNQEGCCSVMQFHKVVYDLLGSSSTCMCTNLALISIPMTENAVVVRTPKSQTGHWVAHMWARSQWHLTESRLELFC